MSVVEIVHTSMFVDYYKIGYYVYIPSDTVDQFHVAFSYKHYFQFSYILCKFIYININTVEKRLRMRQPY